MKPNQLNQMAATLLLISCVLQGKAIAQDAESARSNRAAHVEVYGKAQSHLEGRTNSERAESLVRLGKNAFRKRHFAASVEFFQQAKILDPQNFEAQLAFVYIEWSSGNLQRAAQILKSTLDANPRWPAQRHDPLSFYGAYQQIDLPYQTLAAFSEKNPKNKDAGFLLSFLHFSLGFHEKALTTVQNIAQVEEFKPHLDGMKDFVQINAEPKPQLQMVVLRRMPLIGETGETDGTNLASSFPSTTPGFQPVAYKPAGSLTKNLQVWGSTIETIAAKYDVDPDLVAAVIHVESRFNPMAISHANARGMMQLIPGTARRFGVSQIHDPIENMEGGVRYLRYLLSMFKDVRLTLAAYNAGENNVIRYGGIPPFNETQNYVRNVLATYQSLK